MEPPAGTRAGASPAAAASPTVTINWGDVLTDEEADEALGEFVTGVLPGTRYSQWQTDSGSYLRIEPGSPEDFEPGAEMEGVAGEPVPGVGEGAIWFARAQAPSTHLDFPDEIVTLGILTVRQGGIYFRVMLNLPEVDSAAQLDIAKDLAAKAIDRLP